MQSSRLTLRNKNVRRPFPEAVTLLLVIVLSGPWAVAAEKPLVNLDAAALPEGPLTEWSNTGSLGGVFRG
ncbi:MAG: hypothetical protein NT154_21490, partial [Verrucomicrobia bacterium]|nr:hypothetical protein [Verrucomicrobiota bacterium]